MYRDVRLRGLTPVVGAGRQVVPLPTTPSSFVCCSLRQRRRVRAQRNRPPPSPIDHRRLQNPRTHAAASVLGDGSRDRLESTGSALRWDGRYLFGFTGQSGVSPFERGWTDANVSRLRLRAHEDPHSCPYVASSHFCRFLRTTCAPTAAFRHSNAGRVKPVASPSSAQTTLLARISWISIFRSIA